VSALAGALAQLESWLLEPLPDQAVSATPVELPPQPVIAVVGLTPGCGTTTVARALAARLATRAPERAAIVAGAPRSSALAPATPAAARLRSRLGRGARAVGRLCLCEPPDAAELVGLVPVVLDGGAATAHVADAAIVVAPTDAEPALVELFARKLPTRGHEPLIAVNRAHERERWAGRASLLLPESQMGARLAAAGWEPRGAFGRAVSDLGAACEAVACA
jgi:hypothetical protein